MRIDAIGRSCPEPVIMLKKALADKPAAIELAVDNAAARGNVVDLFFEFGLLCSHFFLHSLRLLEHRLHISAAVLRDVSFHVLFSFQFVKDLVERGAFSRGQHFKGKV